MLPSSFENDFLLLHSLFFLVVQHNIPFLSALGGVKHSLTESLACQSTLYFFLSQLFTEVDTQKCMTRVPQPGELSPGTPVQVKVKAPQPEAPVRPPLKGNHRLALPRRLLPRCGCGMDGTCSVRDAAGCILGVSGPDPSLSQGWRASGSYHPATEWRAGPGRVRAYTWEPGSPGFKCWGSCFRALPTWGRSPDFGASDCPSVKRARSSLPRSSLGRWDG